METVQEKNMGRFDVSTALLLQRKKCEGWTFPLLSTHQGGRKSHSPGAGLNFFFFFFCSEIWEDHLQSVSFPGRKGAILYVSWFGQKENTDEAIPWHPSSSHSHFLYLHKALPVNSSETTQFPPYSSEVVHFRHTSVLPVETSWGHSFLPPVCISSQMGLC